MTDIASVPDVTAEEAAELATLTLHTTADLLRTNRAELVRRVPRLTLTRVRGWQAFAALSELEGITPDLVALLRAAGADSVDELAGWPLARARAALPGQDEERIVGWLKDAVRLMHTGVLNGTVLTPGGAPVEGAEVQVGGVGTGTDARGRFRVTRLPLDRALTVTIHRPDQGELIEPDVRAVRSAALTGRTFTLPGVPAATAVLTELTGDRLPPIGSAPVTTAAQNAPPGPTDVLRVIQRYANGDARVASRFLDFTAGHFVRRTYRIAVADLPADLVPGDDLEHDAGGWQRRQVGARAIGRRVRVRDVARTAKSGPLTPERIDLAAAQLLAALSDR